MGDKSSSSSSSSAVQSGAKPRTRQRVYKAPPTLDVPDIEQDAAERKRVLNVLAQRRYREKKRQRRLKTGQQSIASAQKGAEGPQSAAEEEPGDVVEIGASGFSPQNGPCAGSIAGVDLGLGAWDPLSDPTLCSMILESGPLSDSLTDVASGGGESLVQSHFNASSGMSDMLPSVFSSPSSLDTMSSSSTSDMSFPDSYLLPVHELTLLRAMLRIAQRIGCREQLWSLDAVSPFNKGVATPDDQLPVPWRPTPSQVLVPHHPLLDFLPWPGVRDRIIGILSLPDEARPPNATGPLALVNFAYDFEDNAEGVRIYGGDPYDPACWEVGQVFFERWWFIFDRDIIDNSNRWRRLRGAPPLAIKGSDEREARVSEIGAAMAL
ncbi:Uncharacterized protein TPAR_00461 [Tolypocladium paradoxum]|uniref:BZIP domain-containing protein n=1 Tax=Tolypocladium paradoxum TaxID=94208 RepID=A0A2S4LAA1_9HYPO|nr:Uncharacterized protein TPAR_00461 [Tolypocladium paradoxum]